MLSPDLTSWRSQYEQMKRAYARLSKTYVSSLDYDDDLRHFFQDCWHLKDWIKNAKTNVPASVRNKVETEVSAHKSLRITADLANGCKHLVLNRRRRKGGRIPRPREGAKVISKSVTVRKGGADTYLTVKLDDGTILSAQDVARDAFNQWDAVLRKLGLI